MDTTENTEKTGPVNSPDESRRKFSFLVLMASILSIGSLAWTTWSMLDLFKVDAMVIEKLGNVSLIGLSAAITMDVFWSATMVAEYRGQKLPFTWSMKKGAPWKFNALPLLGWVEVLFVAGLLGYHGSTVGGGAAMFAAVLPVFTKFTWMLALNGLKDPFDLTDDEKAMLAEKKRKSRLTRADADATSEQHDADMIMKNREHEAALADERRRAEIEREKVQAKIEREKLERDAKFAAEQAELEGQNELKAMRQRLNAQLQIATLRTQSEITLERLDAEQDMRLRAPLGINVIQGEVSRPQLDSSSSPMNETFMGLTDAEQRRAELAARYYAADHREGGVTKSAFCKANNINPPRLSEATAAFPVEWFIENDLADWRVES
jgi:hypothetical protein